MPAKIARQLTSGRQPARMPPPSQNSSADTITAVATRSAQTGRPKAWIWSRSQVSGSSTQPTSVLSSTISLPSSHSSGPMTAVVSPAATSFRPPSPMLSLKPDSSPAVQLTPKPPSPPPRSRKKATTGNARKNRMAFGPLAGSRGISSGISRIAARMKARLTRQRSGSG